MVSLYYDQTLLGGLPELIMLIKNIPTATYNVFNHFIFITEKVLSYYHNLSN